MVKTKQIPAGERKAIESVHQLMGKETVKKLLATTVEGQRPIRKISQDPWFCFLKQTLLEARSQDQVKNNEMSAGNNLASPISVVQIAIRQEEAEKSSAMMRTKPIPVRMRKAVVPV